MPGYFKINDFGKVIQATVGTWASRKKPGVALPVSDDHVDSQDVLWA